MKAKFLSSVLTFVEYLGLLRFVTICNDPDQRYRLIPSEVHYVLNHLFLGGNGVEVIQALEQAGKKMGV